MRIVERVYMVVGPGGRPGYRTAARRASDAWENAVLNATGSIYGSLDYHGKRAQLRSIGYTCRRYVIATEGRR